MVFVCGLFRFKYFIVFLIFWVDNFGMIVFCFVKIFDKRLDLYYGRFFKVVNFWMEVFRLICMSYIISEIFEVWFMRCVCVIVIWIFCKVFFGLW